MMAAALASLIILKHLESLYSQCILLSTSRVTVMKDKETRQSKGVVFALFLDQKGAHTAVNALHNKEVPAT